MKRKIRQVWMLALITITGLALIHVSAEGNVRETVYILGQVFSVLVLTALVVLLVAGFVDWLYGEKEGDDVS